MKAKKISRSRPSEIVPYCSFIVTAVDHYNIWYLKYQYHTGRWTAQSQVWWFRLLDWKCVQRFFLVIFLISLPGKFNGLGKAMNSGTVVGFAIAACAKACPLWRAGRGSISFMCARTCISNPKTLSVQTCDAIYIFEKISLVWHTYDAVSAEPITYAKQCNHKAQPRESMGNQHTIDFFWCAFKVSVQPQGGGELIKR